MEKLAKVFGCEFSLRKVESNKNLVEEQIDPEIEESLKAMDEKTISLIDEDEKCFLKQNKSISISNSNVINEISVISTEDSKINKNLSIS